MNSETLSLQRVRNGIIDVLEFISSEGIYSDPVQFLKLWEEWVDDKRLSDYSEPVFSLDEQKAISQFYSICKYVVENTPNPFPRLGKLVDEELIRTLISDASDALETMSRRGKYTIGYSAFLNVENNQ